MRMEEHIPQGFVPLANWDIKHRGNNSGHSIEWKSLGDAVKAGKVPGMKIGGSGRWWVHEASAIEFLAKEQEPKPPRGIVVAGKPKPDHVEAAIVAICRIENSISLLQMTLERFTAAVENIAMQPTAPQHEPAGSWRDMNGEAL